MGAGRLAAHDRHRGTGCHCRPQDGARPPSTAPCSLPLAPAGHHSEIHASVHAHAMQHVVLRCAAVAATWVAAAAAAAATSETCSSSSTHPSRACHPAWGCSTMGSQHAPSACRPHRWGSGPGREQQGAAARDVTVAPPRCRHGRWLILGGGVPQAHADRKRFSLGSRALPRAQHQTLSNPPAGRSTTPCPYSSPAPARQHGASSGGLEAERHAGRHPH